MKKNILLFFLSISFVFANANTLNSNPPSNDDCSNAIDLNCGEMVIGETITATDSGANSAPDVFYTFTGSGTSELITISLCDGGTDYDSYIRVFSDCTLSNEIASNDDTCDLQSELPFVSDGTSTYYIMIEGFQSSSGNFSLQVSCTLPPPINDDCSNAIALNCEETILGETLTATDSGYNSSSDVFYSYTGSGTSEQIIISLCDGGTDYDSWLRVFDDCTLNNQIASNDDTCNFQSEISFISDGTSTYYIMVEGYQEDEGNFSLFTDCQDFNPPANNECNSAFKINCGDIVNGNTSTASSNGGNDSPDLFYNYTGSGQEEWVTLSTCSGATDYNSRLLVYDGCDFGELLSENDDFCDNLAQLTFYSDGISTYQIIVEGSSNSSGNFELNISCELILGIEEESIEVFSFYPNPVKNNVYISALEEIKKVEFFDILGKNVLSKIIESNNFQIDMSNLKSGVYFMKAYNDEKYSTYRIIKN